MKLDPKIMKKPLLDFFKSNGYKCEVEKFDSGALMIDIEKDNRYFCIQLTNKYFGLSEITKEPDFSTVPDESFDNVKDFQSKIHEVFGLKW